MKMRPETRDGSRTRLARCDGSYVKEKWRTRTRELGDFWRDWSLEAEREGDGSKRREEEIYKYR
jgi:hypothetical protein